MFPAFQLHWSFNYITVQGLTDQNILVTGASRGIGRAIAERLLQEKAIVGLHYNSGLDQIDDLVGQFGTKNTIPIQADFADEGSTVKLINQVLEEMGALDTIVINAGIFTPHPIDDPLELWLEGWRRTIQINLEAAAILTKLCLEHFIQNRNGRLIYIGSRAAVRGETEEYLAYAASKGGLTSLAKSVARSFGKYNIKAFVVAPGFTETEMAMDAIASIGKDKVLQNLALNELTKPEDIAPVVALMCSGQMDHATGTTIDINAGSHLR